MSFYCSIIKRIISELILMCSLGLGLHLPCTKTLSLCQSFASAVLCFNMKIKLTLSDTNGSHLYSRKVL